MNLKLKRRVLITMMVPALGLPVALSSFAADADKTAGPAKTLLHVRASQLICKNVENAQGDNLGEIKDLILDVNNERVFYTVLEFGGFLGMGEKLFA